MEKNNILELLEINSDSNSIEINSNFINSVKNLNTNQRKAVVKTNGPLIVFAGPGTGKTQLLSTRIGKILLESDIQPNNILCLTYTDAAAHEMRSRLSKIIGSVSEDIGIFTFHSFCYYIINTYSDYFEEMDFQIATEYDLTKIYSDIVDELYKENNEFLNKSTNKIKKIKLVKSIYEFLKNENISVDHFKSSYQRTIQQIIDNKGEENFYYKRKSGNKIKGDIREAEFDKVKNNKLEYEYIIDKFDTFKAMLKEKKLFEFIDLITLVINKLKENEELRLILQERFQYILVDEFQDTNSSQLEIVNQLCYNIENPNVMVVGDMNQSIYRFQGANNYNITLFRNTYINALNSQEERKNSEIFLTDNYRSSQKILDIARDFISSQNKPSEFLEAKGIYSSFESKTKFCITNQSHIEIISIIDIIKNLLKEGYNYNQIAILVYKRYDTKLLTEYLTGNNIDFVLEGVKNILESSFIKKIIDVFYFIFLSKETNKFDKKNFIKIYLHYFKNFDLEYIFKVKNNLSELDYYKSSSKPLYELLVENQSDDILLKFYKDISTLIKLSNELSIIEFWNLFVYKMDISSWIDNQIETDKIIYLAELSTFKNFIYEEYNQNQYFSFQDLFDKLKFYDQYGLKINLQTLNRKQDAIIINTIHGSKGMEYENVIIFNNVKSSIEGKKNNEFKIDNMTLRNIFSDNKQNLNFEKEDIKNDDIAEKKRLIYVGMTRAKQNLFLTKSLYKSNILKPKLNDSIEMLENINHILEYENLSYTDKQIYDYSKFLDYEVKEKQKKILSNSLINNKLQNINLSQSLISKYLECPKKFYEDRILESSIVFDSIYIIIGNIYHNTIEKIIKNKEESSYENFLKNLLFEAKKYKHFLIDSDFLNLEIDINKNYKVVYDNLKPIIESTNILEPEKKLISLIDNIKINGRIDLLEENKDGSIKIIDFKTGNYATKDFNIKEGEISKYIFQAIMYYILIENEMPDKTIESVEYKYILPNNKDQKFYNHTINKDIIEMYKESVKQTIKQVYQDIQDMKFECLDPQNCNACNPKRY